MTTKTDWHPADIVAALRKKGWSLRRLSLSHGYSSGMVRQAILRPYPKAERIIAEAIGVPPWVIWPSRYDGNTHKGGRRYVPKHTSGPKKRNGYSDPGK